MPEAPFDLRITTVTGGAVRGRATVTGEALVLDQTEPPGSPRSIDLSDIESVRIGQVEVDLRTFEGEEVRLSHLATRFDPFVAAFSAARNERWVRGLLYRDEKVEREFRGEVEHSQAGQGVRDKAMLRIYPSSLVALPDRSDPFSVSFNELRAVTFDENVYALRLALDPEGVVSLYKLGDRFDEFEKILGRLREDLYRRVAAGLRTVLPSLGEGEAAVLARVAGHGRAFTREEAEAAAPGTWQGLTRAVLGTKELEESFGYLSAGAGEDGLYLGLAVEAALLEDGEAGGSSEPGGRPLLDEVSRAGIALNAAAQVPGATTPEEPGEAGEGPASRPYRSWFLVARPERPVLFLEVTSEPGHATYAFRIDPARADVEARMISRALVALNFAREPIYLPEEELASGLRRRYRLALRKLPYLREIRARFLGRAIHNETWQRQVEGLLGA